MKKYQVCMLVILMALTVCACSITQPTENKYDTGTTVPTVPTTSGRPTVPTQQATVTVPTTAPTDPVPTSSVPNTTPTIPTEPVVSTAPTTPTKPTEPTVPHICQYKECQSVEATCTQEGYTEYACECGQSFRAVTGNPPHEYRQTEDGTTCIHCGDVLETPEEGGDDADSKRP